MLVCQTHIFKLICHGNFDWHTEYHVMVMFLAKLGYICNLGTLLYYGSDSVVILHLVFARCYLRLLLISSRETCYATDKLHKVTQKIALSHLVGDRIGVFTACSCGQADMCEPPLYLLLIVGAAELLLTFASMHSLLIPVAPSPTACWSGYLS